MFKNLFVASLMTVGFVSSAQAQTLSKSFDVNENGANATLIGLGNINVDRNGRFQVGPAASWNVETGKLSDGDWNLAVQYLGVGRDALKRGESEFGVNDQVINVEFENSILKYERRGSQIEQIIVVKHAPAGSGDLRVGFSMSDTFSYELKKDGGFTVSNLERTLLKFGSLTTIDATGRILPSRIEIKKNIATYIVEDEGAVYPVTIDPIISTPSVTVLGQNAGNLAVALDGLDINNDGFEDLIVGEDRFSNADPMNRQSPDGKIYLFLGSAAGLSATAAWVLEPGETDAKFGATVRNLGDINGDGNDDFAIGAALSSKGVSFGGNVSVFLGDEAAPGTPVWEANGTQLIELFGSDIAVGDFNCDGNPDIAISSQAYNDSGTNNGRVQIYSGSDVFPYFEATNSFSKTFADGSQGGTSMIAANINGDKGSVNNKDCIDLVVGRPRSDAGGAEAGGFDVFLGAETGPSTTPSSSHEGTEPGARSGFSLAAGDVNKDGFDDIVVGAYLADNNSDINNILIDAGLLSIYDGSMTGLSATASLNILGSAAEIRSGFSFGLADFDNNGFLDIAAGASGAPGGLTAGSVFVYLNGSGVPSVNFAWTTSNGGIGGRFGDTVIAGDFNNDGNQDLVVSAVLSDMGQGSFYVYNGQNTCTIGADVFSSGDISTEGCGICDPAKTTTDWSVLPVGTECAMMCSGESTSVSTCDAAAKCVEAGSTDCGAYTCDAASTNCFDSCLDDAQCEVGASCEANVCVSRKPTAVVSGPQTGTCSETIVLSAADSTDPANAELTFTWNQIGTPDVLSGVDTASETLSFTAPIVSEDTVLRFSLIAKNATLDSDTVFYVVNIPSCASTGDTADTGSDVGTDTIPGSDAGQDSGKGSDVNGNLSGGGCGCMSSQNTNPAGSIFLVFILGFLALRRKKRA